MLTFACYVNFVNEPCCHNSSKAYLPSPNNKYIMNLCKTTQPQKRKNKEETQLPGRKCKGKRTTTDSPTTGAGASSTASTTTTKNNNDIAVETTFSLLNPHQGSTTPPSPDDTENLLSGPLLLTPKEDQNQHTASVAARELT